MRFHAGTADRIFPKTPSDRRWEPTHETSEPCLSVHLQLRVPGTGLLQPELPGEIPAARGRCDPGAGLCRDARGLGAALVLFLPAHRAARARGAAAFRPR